MRTRSLLIVCAILILISCKSAVKEPSVAGSFYPADPVELKSTVAEFLSRAEKKDVPGRILALISPHAGYVYSGQVAAFGYKNLHDIDTVILIGPSHYGNFQGASVYAEGSFKTPLGEIPIDERLARSFIDTNEDVGFYPDPFAREHSLEVQLPFLQGALGRFKIVPILISQPTPAMFEHLTELIAQTLASNKRAIIVASSDLSHYHDYEIALGKDSKMIESIEQLSPVQCESTVRSGKGEMCGAYPVMVAIEASRRMGANQAVVFKYANSGDVTGALDSVVGYVSLGIYKTPLSDDEKKELLDLARRTIVERVRNAGEIEYETQLPKFRAEAAVFVTINRQGRLRGCIGNIVPVMPLYQSVIKNAISASVHDPRFIPMSPSELDDMEIELSILSPLIPVESTNEIVVGRDGLYIIKGKHTGVLLPQVAPAFGWTREEFLEHVSEKAGLPNDAWRDGAQLFRFEAEVIK